MKYKIVNLCGFWCVYRRRGFRWDLVCDFDSKAAARDFIKGF